MGHFNLGQANTAVILAGEADHLIPCDQALNYGRTAFWQSFGVAKDQLNLFAQYAAG